MTGWGTPDQWVLGWMVIAAFLGLLVILATASADSAEAAGDSESADDHNRTGCGAFVLAVVILICAVVVLKLLRWSL